MTNKTPREIIASWTTGADGNPGAVKAHGLNCADTLISMLDTAGFAIVRQGTKCPFGKNMPDPGLKPTDPCPICGDLGTFEATDQPSKCIG